MQWAVQDNGKGTDHAGLEEDLKADIEAMHLDKEAADMSLLMQRGFDSVRTQMDGPARLAKGVECKEEANGMFARREWIQALAGYAAGIWFLQRGDPPCPKIVSSAMGGETLSKKDKAALEELATVLGAGAPGPGEKALATELEAERVKLRVALHLNLAAAALRLSQWAIARTACQYVLMVDGNKASPKARYRLAKALEGEEQRAEACEVLETLLKADPDNADAKELLAALKARLLAEEALAAPDLDYDTITQKEWATLSQEQQQKALDTINAKLDDEMGKEPDWDGTMLEGLIRKG